MLSLFPYFIVLLAGAVLPFAFAPTGFFPLAVLSPVVLLLILQQAKPKKAAEYGFVYGLGAFGVGVSWVYISIHTYGNTNPIFAGLITSLFVIILSLFPALVSYLLKRFFSFNHSLTTTLIAFPSLWTLSEWLRSWIFTGFPWLLLGQSQTNSPLHSFAPIVGVYGLTFLVILSAGIIFNLIKRQQFIINFLLFIVIWLGAWGLSFIHWTTQSGEPIKVSLIQGNIPQSIKWSPDQALKTLNTYETLTKQHWDSELIVWPESAITILLDDAVNILSSFDKLADQKNTAVITGIPIPQGNDEANNYFNGVIVLGDGGGHYLKRHLVPFGEYVPFADILRGLIGFFNLPMSDFVPGPMQQSVLESKNIKIAPFVCYEVAYSDLLRTNLPEANLLTTLSNDTWFDRSAALSQHRQIAQLAAQLTGRYMLVATNSGETAIIDPQGNILAQAPIDETIVLNGTVYSMEGATPWVKLGNTPFIILFSALLAFAWWRNNKK